MAVNAVRTSALAVVVLAVLAAASARAADLPRYYYDRPLTENDLAGRSLRELTLMRNTIFARAGQPFRKRWIHEYFQALPWYRAKSVVNPKTLSAVDQANADLLSRYEISIPRAELEQRLQAILDRHRSVIGEEISASAAVAFTPDGREALVTDGQWARLVDASTGAEKGAWSNSGLGGTFGLFPGARTALFVDEGGRVHTTSLANPNPGRKPANETQLMHHLGWMRAIVFSPDGRRLMAGPAWTRQAGAEGGEARTPVPNKMDVIVVDIASGKVLFRRDVDDPDLTCLAFTPDGKRAVFAAGKSMQLVDVVAGKALRQAPLPVDHCYSLAVFPDGQRVVAFSRGATTTWEVETGKARPGFTARLSRAIGAVSPDGQRILVGGFTSAGETLQLWDIKGAALIRSFAIRDEVLAVAWSPDGRRALTASKHGRTLWDVDAGRPIPTFTGHQAWWNQDERIEALLLSRALGRQQQQLAYLDVDRTPLDAPELLDELVETATTDGMSRRDLRILRNMVYARRGRPFRSPLLRAYFERLDWYKADPAYTDDRLTPVDRRNIKLVMSAEIAAGGPLNDAGQTQEEYIPEA
jgi:WD40 repeat protein